MTLPDGEDMDEANRITVTVTDHKQVPQEGLTVTVKSDMGRTEQGVTDANGKVTVPPVTEEIEDVRHAAYIVGYPDGTFSPSNNMTRSEAAAIFARILAAKKKGPPTATMGGMSAGWRIFQMSVGATVRKLPPYQNQLIFSSLNCGVSLF